MGHGKAFCAIWIMSNLSVLTSIVFAAIMVFRCKVKIFRLHFIIVRMVCRKPRSVSLFTDFFPEELVIIYCI